MRRVVLSLLGLGVSVTACGNGDPNPEPGQLGSLHASVQVSDVDHDVTAVRFDAAAVENLKREAKARGVAPERLHFAKHVSQDNYLARFGVADLFLDTVPYNAHSTAVDALWGGVPVLTCSGSAFASRVAGSLLESVGLPELVTGNLKDYEALAIRLAKQPQELRALRERLAASRKSAPLFDTVKFCRYVESAYRTMWETARRGGPPRSFAVEAGPSRS